MNKEITASKVQEVLYHSFCHGNVILLNSYIFSKKYETDFAYITKNGFGYEIEIKRSYTDFLADFYKGKHEEILAGKGLQNYFIFCFSSEQLAKKCMPDIPDKYGILYIDGFYAKYLQVPTKLHNRKLEAKYVLGKLASSYKTKIFKGK